MKATVQARRAKTASMAFFQKMREARKSQVRPMHHTKRSTLLLLPILLLLGAAGDEGNKADLTKLQGEWVMVSGSKGGQPLPPAAVASGRRVCKGDQLTVTVGGMLIMKATITLDASKDPKTIDYHVTEGPSAGEMQLGIYEFTGEDVRFCFGAVGKARPDAFETKQGDGRTLSEWKRANN